MSYQLGGQATIEVEGVRQLVVIVEVVDAYDELFAVRDEQGHEHYANPDFNSLQPAEPEYSI